MKRRDFLATVPAASAALAAKSASAADTKSDAAPAKPHLRYAVNVQTHFSKHPMPERLRRVAALGFTAVEYNGLFDHDQAAPGQPNLQAIAAYGALLKTLGLAQGVWVTNGCAGMCDSNITDPAKHARFLDKVRLSRQISPLVDGTVSTVTSGLALPGLSTTQMTDNVVEALKRAADIVADSGPTLVLEPLNVLEDHPGYFVVTSPHAVEIIERVNHPRVKILFDIYHQQISEGNLIRNIRQYYPLIGYFQFGDNPGRHEPYTGEIHYPNVFRAIKELGFTGMLGGEYSPAGGGSDEASEKSMAAVLRADREMMAS